MEEIGNCIFLEKSYSGVVLGAIRLDQGLLLVDSPLQYADQQSWREQTNALGEGVDRFVLMLDTHIDRTLGLSTLGGILLGYEKTAQILSERPQSPKIQELGAGSEVEALNLPVNTRWPLPAMTFSHDLELYADEKPITITHRRGSHLAGCWVRSDQEKLIFVGDSVLEHQPPFLSWADLDTWLEDLSELLSEPWADYRIISGRSGLVRRKAVEQQIELLTLIRSGLSELAAAEDQDSAINDALPKFMRRINYEKKFANQYRRRLASGLADYLKHHKSLDSQGEKEHC